VCFVREMRAIPTVRLRGLWRVAVESSRVESSRWGLESESKSIDDGEEEGAKRRESTSTRTKTTPPNIQHPGFQREQ